MNSVLTPEFYSSIIQHSHDMICIIHPDGVYKYVSNSVVQQMGYAEAELVGKVALHHIHTDDLPYVLAVLEEINHTRQIKAKPFRYLHKNGSWRWLSCVITNMLDNPTIGGFVTNSRDVTEEAEAIRLLEKKEAYYRALFFNHPDLVFTLNEQGIIQESNLYATELFGYQYAETFGKHFANFVAPTHLETALQAFRKVIASGAHTFETKIIDKNQQLLDLSVTLVPVWLNNRITAVHCVAKDITQVKLSEKLLKDQAGQLNNMLSSITESFFALNNQWCLTYANRQFATYFNLPVESMLNKNIWQENPELVRTVFYQKCMEVMATGKPAENEEYIPTINAVTHYRIYPFDNGIAVCFTDITAKRAAQNELNKLSLVASKTTNGVIITNNKGLVEWANNSFLKLMGYNLPELLQRDPITLLQGPETSKEVVENLRRMFYLAVPFSEEVLTYKKNGDKLWIAADVTPILDETGTVEKYIIIYTDISDRKFAETQLLQMNENLVKQNRDLQQFTYMVSHNLRGPVANIVGLSRMLPKLEADNPSFKTAIANLDKSAQRLDAVIHDLSKILSIKTPDSSETLEPVELHTLSTEVLQSLHDTTTSIQATVDVQVAHGIVLQAKRAYLYSILHNLITNAIKYRSEERSLHLQLHIYKDQDGIWIKVADNGLGMDMEVVRSQIFKLYNRFHVHTEGRGIGLYLVKSQVETMGGTIEVESTKGVGTTFRIQFKAQN